jgi:hypothetical protein
MRAFLLIVLLVLAGCSRQEQASKTIPASMTIHAIAPTGGKWYQPPQPIWQFAITNTGSSDVVWNAGVQAKDRNDRDYSNAGGTVDWPQGVLAPGKGLVTEMIVPAKTGNVWRAYIEFWTVSQQNLKAAQSEAARFRQSVSEFCPRKGTKGTYTDEWHQ